MGGGYNRRNLLLCIEESLMLGGKARLITIGIPVAYVVIYAIMMIIGNIGVHKSLNNGRKPARLGSNKI